MFFTHPVVSSCRFHSVSGSSDVRTRYLTTKENAFPRFHWNALERVRNANGRVRNANGTRSERVPDAFRTQMERERSVRLFLSSTVLAIRFLISRITHLCVRGSARPFKGLTISDFYSVHFSGAVWSNYTARPLKF